MQDRARTGGCCGTGVVAGGCRERDAGSGQGDMSSPREKPGGHGGFGGLAGSCWGCAGQWCGATGEQLPPALSEIELVY